MTGVCNLINSSLVSLLFEILVQQNTAEIQTETLFTLTATEYTGHVGKQLVLVVCSCSTFNKRYDAAISLCLRWSF